MNRSILMARIRSPPLPLICNLMESGVPTYGDSYDLIATILGRLLVERGEEGERLAHEVFNTCTVPLEIPDGMSAYEVFCNYTRDIIRGLMIADRAKQHDPDIRFECDPRRVSWALHPYLCISIARYRKMLQDLPAAADCGAADCGAAVPSSPRIDYLANLEECSKIIFAKDELSCGRDSQCDS